MTDIKGKRVVDCAGIALINRGRVFLIRPMFNGIVQQFGFPKGHAENGESLEDAAEREFSEETGISINGLKKTLLGSVYAKIDDSSVKKVTIFTVNGNGDEKFKSSNLTEDGIPENIGGCYIDYERARELITAYQQPLIDKLIDKETESFGNFLSTRLD